MTGALTFENLWACAITSAEMSLPKCLESIKAIHHH
jgi:hypothetical protein